jgi:hypothetical protein
MRGGYRRNRLSELLAQEGDGARVGELRGVAVELRAVRLDEPVLRAGVDMRGAALAEGPLQVGDLGGVVELIVLGEMAEVWDPVGRLEDAAVEGDEGADRPTATASGQVSKPRSTISSPTRTLVVTAPRSSA